MRRLVPAFVLLLALALVPAAPVRAFDAQQVFAKAKDSVVIVVGFDASGKIVTFGSGFAMGDGAQVLTVIQVVEKAAAVAIKAPGGEPRMVEVVNTDSYENLALLKCSETIPPLDFSTEEVLVGQDVVAIGSPMGLELTLSTGVVSALRQGLNRSLIQITAPVSFGSQGGPVLDAAGKVVGVVFGERKKGQNLNFAISYATALHFLGRPLKRPKPAEQAAQPQQNLEIKKRADGSIEIVQPRRRTQ